jgi:hypothetical protein
VEHWDEASCLRLAHLMAGAALRAHDDHGEIDDVAALRVAARRGTPWQSAMASPASATEATRPLATHPNVTPDSTGATP